jgi:hypothetical protein
MKQTIDQIEETSYSLELDFIELQIIRNLLLERHIDFECMKMKKDEREGYLDAVGTNPMYVEDLLDRVTNVTPNFKIK